MRSRTAIASAVLAFLASGGAVRAQDADDFFKGKTLTIFAGSTAGGGVDLYARMIAQHLPDHMPSHPTIIVQDQPGAGSLVSAHNLYSVAPKDGTQLAITLPGALFDPLMNARDLSKYDPRKFNYLGNSNADATVCVVRHDAPVQDFAQVFSKQLVVAATGPGSVSLENPVFENNLLGTKLKVISGYPGSNEMRLAVYNNEVQGLCGEQWSSAKAQFPETLHSGGLVKVLVEEDAAAVPALANMGVPLITKYAKTDEQKRVLELFMQQGTVSRPFMLPPGVPPGRVAALRKAFDETMKDPALLADAAKAHLDVNYKTGEEVQTLINSIYAAPAALIAEMRKASAM
jgi:tripartite-type tricarboxylate transporter receptor subunit TctC